MIYRLRDQAATANQPGPTGDIFGRRCALKSAVLTKQSTVRPSFWAKPSLSNWVSPSAGLGCCRHKRNLEILTIETINKKNASQSPRRGLIFRQNGCSYVAPATPKKGTARRRPKSREETPSGGQQRSLRCCP